MEQPTTIKFSGLDVNVDDLLLGAPRGPMDRRWTRIQFPIPDTYDAPDKVRKWITDNVIHHWSSYTFTNPKDSTYQMIVRFEDRNDALMFKLKGGHQTWEA